MLLREILAAFIAPILICQPALSATTTGPTVSCNTTENGFGIMDGVIYGLDHQPWIGHGVNVGFDPWVPSANQLLTSFKGLNVVRLAVGNFDPPEKMAPYIDDLTSHNIVVILDQHQNNAGGAGGAAGAMFTGSALDQEQNWFAANAKYFAKNPRVWFGTNNEPSEAHTAGGQNDPAALSAWQGMTIDTIRRYSNTIVLVEANSWGAGKTNTGYDRAVYLKRDNIAWDVHWYGWPIPNTTGAPCFQGSCGGYGMDQGEADRTLMAIIAEAQSYKSAGGTMPVFIGEYGNSTTGQAIDRNWEPTLNALFKVFNQYGSTAWLWGKGYPGDGLTDPDGTPSSPYGQLVAKAIASAKQPPSQDAGCAVGARPTTVAVVGPVQALPTSVAPPPGLGMPGDPGEQVPPSVANTSRQSIRDAQDQSDKIKAQIQQIEDRTKAQINPQQDDDQMDILSKADAGLAKALADMGLR